MPICNIIICSPSRVASSELRLYIAEYPGIYLSDYTAPGLKGHTIGTILHKLLHLKGSTF